MSQSASVGRVVGLWRYSVKSMIGEELNAVEVTERGLLGDRAYAVVDTSDGKVASAKNPRKWPQLFDFRAAFVDAPRTGAQLPPVRITLPDGGSVASEHADVSPILSKVLSRKVTLESTERARHEAGMTSPPRPSSARAEEYWPDMEGLDYRDTVTDFDLPEGTFFDCALVHLLTTATLNRLRELYPQGRFETRRFRPHRGGTRRRREGLCRECVDRRHARHRRGGPPQHYGPLPSLRHDDAPPGRSPQGSGDPPHRRATQPSQRWRLRIGASGRPCSPR
jgi:hypothetical protein